MRLSPGPRRVAGVVADYARRVWDNAGDDDIFFLASAVAFNILLAAVPFVLLLLSAIGYWLNHSLAQSSADVWSFIETLLPPHEETGTSPYHRVIDEIIRTRRSVGAISAVLFIWFTTRLFGTLRAALASVFDVHERRSILGGKLFDAALTLGTTGLFIAYTGLSSYLKIQTARGMMTVAALGVRHDVLGRLAYYAAAMIATVAIGVMFFALYKFLPNRPIRWKSAAVAACVTTGLLQIAKALFERYLRSFSPGSLYTGTLYAVVIVVFWVYYAALIFLIGGEVGQAYDIRRAMRLQRETFEKI